ncbi:MAG: urease accessory protein UreE [Aestuariivita sp.]|nr:urease accessory protein UreE [Aestuariivita sp.]
MTIPISREIINKGHCDDYIVLDYDKRFLRRRILTTKNDLIFMVDLPKAISVHQDQAFLTDDQRTIGIISANEELLQITGNLAKLAWHIGNRHTPCQIEKSRLVIQKNPVIQDMLERLGASVTPIYEPFEPERGAYGLGRTYSHAH